VSRFLRKYEMLIGEGGKEGLLITDFHIEFDITKSADSNMNTAVFRIYNLNRDHRKQLQSLEEKDGYLYFRVGYADEPLVLLFVGNIISYSARREGAEIITELTCGDGYRYIVDSDINVAYPENTSLTTIFNDLAKATGASIGNISGKALGKVFKNGITLSGRVYNYLDQYCRTYHMSWSINDGVIDIRDINSKSQSTGYLITPENGLIGEPSETNNKVNKKKAKTKQSTEELVDDTPTAGVSFTCLLQPEIRPDRVVEVRSNFVGGFYAVKSVTHKGSFEGSDWYTEVEGDLIK
jgi:hypothetical protein